MATTAENGSMASVYLQKIKDKLPKREFFSEKFQDFKANVLHSRQKRFYIIFGLLLATCLLLLFIRSNSYKMLSISDADNMYSCGCPANDGETELHQMTRYVVFYV